MQTGQLLPKPPTTSLKRLLLVPVIVLAIPVAASYAGYKWMQTRGVSFHLIFHQTKDGWRQMPMPAGSLADNLRVSSRGTVWLDTWAGVSRWDGSAWRLYEETGSHDKAGPHVWRFSSGWRGGLDSKEKRCSSLGRRALEIYREPYTVKAVRWWLVAARYGSSTSSETSRTSRTASGRAVRSNCRE